MLSVLARPMIPEQAGLCCGSKWPFQPAGGSIHYGQSGIQADGNSILPCFHYWRGREGGRGLLNHTFLSGNDMGVSFAPRSLAKSVPWPCPRPGCRNVNKNIVDPTDALIRPECTFLLMSLHMLLHLSEMSCPCFSARLTRLGV